MTCEVGTKAETATAIMKSLLVMISESPLNLIIYL
jgi:hypothetical protein